jgi:predicted nuclease with TOPRIM domain
VSSDAAETDGRPRLLPAEYVRLEAAVKRLLDEAAGFRARAKVAEQRAAELERTLRDVSSGTLNPVQLRERLEEIEEENQELRGRMVTARDRVRRLIDRFDFLGEEI